MKTHIFPNYFFYFIPIFLCFPYLINSVPRSPTQRGGGDFVKRREELTQKIEGLLWEK